MACGKHSRRLDQRRDNLRQSQRFAFHLKRRREISRIARRRQSSRKTRFRCCSRYRTVPPRVRPLPRETSSTGNKPYWLRPSPVQGAAYAWAHPSAREHLCQSSCFGRTAERSSARQFFVFFTDVLSTPAESCVQRERRFHSLHELLIG